MGIRLRIERIYGTFYHPGFDKYEVAARCYINGKCRFKRLFFNSKQETEHLKEGGWIEY